jgi:hypothetical protein
MQTHESNASRPMTIASQKKKVYIISNDQRDTWSSVDCTVGGLETNKLRIICVMKTNGRLVTSVISSITQYMTRSM